MYEAVAYIAVPMPPTILRRKLNARNDVREGILDTNLMCVYVSMCVCVRDLNVGKRAQSRLQKCMCCVSSLGLE